MISQIVYEAWNAIENAALEEACEEWPPLMNTVFIMQSLNMLLSHPEYEETDEYETLETLLCADDGELDMDAIRNATTAIAKLSKEALEKAKPDDDPKPKGKPDDFSGGIIY